MARLPQYKYPCTYSLRHYIVCLGLKSRSRMWCVFAIQLISILLTFRADLSYGQCSDINWGSSLDRVGWSTCPDPNTYLKGLWRNDKRQGDERVGRIETARCCNAFVSAYHKQPSTCTNANWLHTLDRTYVWALCPAGYYMQGMRLGAGPPAFLHHIDEAKCCKPQGHPNSYEHCYEEDLTYKFDNKGWGFCKQLGYYLVGIYKSGCNQLYCLEKFRCCKMKLGAVNGGWSNWGAWEQCSATCGQYARQERTRSCTNPPPSLGGAQCFGEDRESRSCSSQPCPVNGGWSSFGFWGQCSTSCGPGYQERVRSCTNPPPSGGGAQCSGENRETRSCNSGGCAVFDRCVPCSGPDIGTRPCNQASCSINGGWSRFGNWGSCSVYCGSGVQERSRTCTNPPPSGGGAQCSGPGIETRVCSNGGCPVNGGWSNFGAWSQCTKTCGGGTQTRERTCTNPRPAYGGRQCIGDSKEERKCNTGPCAAPNVDGGFTQWSAFSKCSKTCGRGRKTRARECTNPPPSGSGKNCKGKYSETVKCKVRSCKKGKGK